MIQASSDWRLLIWACALANAFLLKLGKEASGKIIEVVEYKMKLKLKYLIMPLRIRLKHNHKCK